MTARKSSPGAPDTHALVESYPTKPEAYAMLDYWAKQLKTLNISGLVFAQRIQGSRQWGIFAVATMPTNGYRE